MARGPNSADSNVRQNAATNTRDGYQQDTSRRSATQAMEEYFHLIPEERAALIPSGASTYAANRTGWAMTFLTKGGLIEKVVPKTYRATKLGRTFLKQHPSQITEKDLRTIPGWKESWAKGNRKQAPSQTSKVGQDNTTPVEALDDAIAILQS